MTASKLYRVESFVASLAIKAPVITETTVNITLSGLQTVNGVVLVAGDRVLVKDQTDPVENGIYEANTSAWERAGDWDGERDATNGTLVIVARSTLVALWQMTTATVPFTPGTDSCTFQILTGVDVLGRLADTATGEGASLVAIEDAAANFTATDVEAALAEILSNLASVANGLGASLVGIEDPNANFTATDVEGALEELGDAGAANAAIEAVKTADTSRNTTITLSDDDHIANISLPVGRYTIEGFLNWTQSGSGGGNGIQMQIARQSGTFGAAEGAVVYATQVAAAVGGANFGVLNPGSVIGTAFADALTDNRRGHYRGTVEVTVAAVVDLRWAQNVSNADNVTLREGSYLRFTPIS